MAELTITDANLKPIADKVLIGERLSFEDGVTLYRSPDLLAVGWLANFVREKRHGDVTYYNVNRHINPDEYLRGALQVVRVWPRSEFAGCVYVCAGRDLRTRGARRA